MFPRRRMFVSESDSVPHFLCQCTVCLQPAIRGSHHVRGYSGDWGLYGLPCPCILVQAWPSGHIITKSFTRCFFSTAPSPYCWRLLIPHKATCLSCDVCRHSQLSQRDSCSSSPLWEPRLSLQKLILISEETPQTQYAGQRHAVIQVCARLLLPTNCPTPLSLGILVMPQGARLWA